VIALVFVGAVFLALWGTTYAFFPPLMRSVRSGVRRIALWLCGRSRLGPMFGRLESWRSHFPLVIALATGTLIIVWTADAFNDLAAALEAHDPTVQRVDAGVHAWFASRRTSVTSTFFLTLTTLGSAAGMTALVALVLVVLLARRRFRWATYLAITSLGGLLLNQFLKSRFVRPRPDLASAVLDATGWSFPSGHAMSSTVILGALAYLAARSMREWRNKSAVLAGLATLALAIGVSRVYLGVHWTSDVAAGFVAGLLWVTATTTGYELFRQVRLRRTEMARGRSAPGP
jgi:undecaprenyl-diphosphatase